MLSEVSNARLCQVEMLSLLGDITLENGKPKVHAHVVLGRADASAPGGHLVEGIVRPMMEIIVTETPRYLGRRLDPESGLSLIDTRDGSSRTRKGATAS
jgi:uncharacterized protein